MLGDVTLQHFTQHLLFLEIFVKCYVEMLPYNRTFRKFTPWKSDLWVDKAWLSDPLENYLTFT